MSTDNSGQDEPGPSNVVAKLPSNKDKVVSLSRRQLTTDKLVRTVLPEDAYLDKLGNIIQKDYYPDIPKLKAQLEYLQAVDKNDVAKITELQLRYSTKRTERRTSPTDRRRSPDVFDPSDDGGDGRRPSTAAGPSGHHDDPIIFEEGDNLTRTGNKTQPMRPEDLSVDKFLDKYTSEDNASFEELNALADKRERIKHGWMYDAEQRHNKELVCQSDSSIKAPDEQFALPAPPRPLNMDNWTYATRSHVLFYHDKDAPWTVEERVRRQKMAQRTIQKDATRFTSMPWKETKQQEAMSKAALLQAAHNKGQVDLSGEVVAGFRNPAEKFSNVVTPSPAPGVADSPMMTWGEIEGTPFRLDAADMPVGDGGPAFKMPDVPVRDKIAEEMTNSIARRYREKRKRAIDQAQTMHKKTPRFGSARSSETIESMSPAARRLATSKLGIRLGTDKALRASYTPTRPNSSKTTPSRTPVSSKTPTSGRKHGRTRTPTVVPSSTASSSITDNLLQLTTNSRDKHRPSAKDFF